MAKNILHMLSPLKHMSPFDVNMALDAGYDSVTPYSAVTLEDVMPLVQDAMFSRSPKDAVRTGLFIAGKDAGLALDMLEIVKKTLPQTFRNFRFRRSGRLFHHRSRHGRLRREASQKKKDSPLAKTKILIFGATGVVGYASAVIAALEGAEVLLVGHDGLERVQDKAHDIKRRFGVETQAVDGSTEEKKLAALAGDRRRPLRRRGGQAGPFQGQLVTAKSLLVSADVNAVPPAGIEGLDLHGDGRSSPAEASGSGRSPLATLNTRRNRACFSAWPLPTRRSALIFATLSRSPVNSSEHLPERRRGSRSPPPPGAPSPRPRAELAIRPLVADFFDDADTRALASANCPAAPAIPKRASSASLTPALERLAEGDAPIGVVYGAGFEDRVEIL